MPSSLKGKIRWDTCSSNNQRNSNVSNYHQLMKNVSHLFAGSRQFPHHTVDPLETKAELERKREKEGWNWKIIGNDGLVFRTDDNSEWARHFLISWNLTRGRLRRFQKWPNVGCFRICHFYIVMDPWISQTLDSARLSIVVFFSSHNRQSSSIDADTVNERPELNLHFPFLFKSCARAIKKAQNSINHIFSNLDFANW